ncbi:NAD(P)H-dependent FMN reductase C4B3.06c [Schizosaccharomyces pombe]|uniref:NAD(P)H-dependent FMN reductase C4B3.06c n=1 Tax=Schizosaccharomyces pombe (strain 972 / ATCC 24843) TaxID=284812 RepID=FMNR_SCHPO|nr:putative NADPH-dependent FMN reductase [Schizosaccharomyces pombe]Q9USJ6.1 RecName: Full=NAD(P)H-dependent FMN reductase C4B3.06c; Short=FMN reductase C4B3.06c; AltName: Full=Azoreductase C4B3.06c; AltName: Full=FMN reductase [NAD(P)H] [Schizosaccharomyces pombe 972h-]CAB60680.1 NADPH-dependent FMN reductase (predicted) [Schizosaccharomyces pombe]|eukprot:NP_588084.1 putative NADPH-dependent FMN reductase [Schizosaccharomyces pombe]
MTLPEKLLKITPKILVIMGSVRSKRLCPTIATWVGEMGKRETNFDYEKVDLTDWPLSMSDEPGLPIMGIDVYTQEHTKAWGSKIAGADGFVFVTPQYNGGYPAILKNALDHLYHEWNGKPLLIVSYGGHGGGDCASQLKHVAGFLKMRVAPTMPALTLPRDKIVQGVVDPAVEFTKHLGELKKAFGEFSQLFESNPERKP